VLTPLDSVSISSYFVKDTRVWISVAGEGIFSLDVDTEAGTEEWRLSCCLAGGPRGARAGARRRGHRPHPRGPVPLRLRVRRARVPRWGRTWRETIPWECYYDGDTPSREMVSLAYMGRGRFIVSRPVDMVDECGRVTSHFTSFLALELMRLRAADGELVLAKRGSLTVTDQGGWADGKILYSVVVSILRAISIEQKLLISLLMM
jgi:hypothetical protein